MLCNNYWEGSSLALSSRGFAAPKMAAACFVSAKAFMGSVTVRGCKFSLGRSSSSESLSLRI